LIGSVGLRDIDREHEQAELGFWIGREWWGHGYAREAAAAVIAFGFGVLGLNRICAHHMERNPAAGRVLQAAGMQREGILRQRVRKWGAYEDVVLYAILRDDGG
jgi:RimJ/RimL family protein N-acetyltransferase